jgi:hypothetical protein
VNDFQNGLSPGAVIGMQGNNGGHSTLFIKYTEDGKGMILWGDMGRTQRNFNNNNSKKIVRGANFK